MKTPILAIPVEILTHVYEACEDFAQVLALALTCKYAHTAWATNSPTIIWSVGKSQIRSFDDALMAVRATAIVLTAYQAGTLPPAVTAMSSLSGKTKLPDLVELKEVLNMQYLVRCIEYMYFYSSMFTEFPEYDPWEGDTVFQKYPAERRRFPECLSENIPGAANATIDSFREGFYRAMYRVLLAGAVLARAYMEPLFLARKEADAVIRNRFFVCWGESYWSQEVDDLQDQLNAEIGPTDADLAYIRQSRVYNFDVPDWSDIGQWRNREYEVCFGPFASWIVEDGRNRIRKEPQLPTDVEPSWAQNMDDIGAVRELMLLLVAYDHLGDHIRQGYHIPESLQGNRAVTVVRIGQFQAEQITLPAAVEDLKDTGLLAARIHTALWDTEGQDIPLQFDFYFASWVLPNASRSLIPSRLDHPGPPVALELWNFALRHYLNLTFQSGTFQFSELESRWWREVGRGDIFLNPNWAVVQKYEPGIISWDYRNN